MSIVLPALAVAFAAFCVWLGVRIFNRRERWAKWTAVGVAIALGYPLSVGPACWIEARIRRERSQAMFVSTAYRPIINWMVSTSDSDFGMGTLSVQPPVRPPFVNIKRSAYHYVQFGLPKSGINLHLDDYISIPPMSR